MKVFEMWGRKEREDAVREPTEREHIMAQKALDRIEPGMKVASIGVDSKTGNINFQCGHGHDFVLDVKTGEAQKVGQEFPESVEESLNEDEAFTQIADMLYNKRPDLFTQHGDEYVMGVIDDVVKFGKYGDMEAIVNHIINKLDNNQSDNEVLDEKAPPGMEDWIKDRKPEFKERYGDRWEEVLYATAWKQHNAKESVEEEIVPFDHEDPDLNWLDDETGEIFKHKPGSPEEKAEQEAEAEKRRISYLQPAIQDMQQHVGDMAVGGADPIDYLINHYGYDIEELDDAAVEMGFKDAWDYVESFLQNESTNDIMRLAGIRDK